MGKKSLNWCKIKPTHNFPSSFNLKLYALSRNVPIALVRVCETGNQKQKQVT